MTGPSYKQHGGIFVISGTRDTLVNSDLLEPVVKKLGRRAKLHILEGTNPSFQILKRSERTEGSGKYKLKRSSNRNKKFVSLSQVNRNRKLKLIQNAVEHVCKYDSIAHLIVHFLNRLLDRKKVLNAKVKVG